MTIQGLINKIFRANQTQNNTVSWSGSNGLKTIQEDIVETIRERTFFTVPTTADLANQGFNNAVLCYVQDDSFYRWNAVGIPNGTTIFSANDGGVWVQESVGNTGYVPYVGATSNVNLGTYSVLMDNGVTNSETSPSYFAVENAAATTYGLLEYNQLTMVNGASSMAITAAGITFPNGSVQTTAFPPTGGTTAQYIRGDGSLSTFPIIPGSGITSLNGLLPIVQSFATGTIGTDFNISSVTATHTFNIPTASGTNRGALSPSDWTIFNNKQNALTFSSPLSNTLNIISISQANNSINGYLSATDWVAFNSKQNAISLTTTGSSGSATFISNTLNIPTYTLTGLGGVPTSTQLTINGTSYDLSANRTWSVGTVTSVAALTLGTTGTDVSSTVANGTSTPVITLNIPTASASNRGVLSSTDWSTFNSKQNTITLTTIGTSGAATLVGSTLNIPNYNTTAAAKYYGAWQTDTTQTAIVDNIGYGVKFDIADITANGISIQADGLGNNTLIKMANAGYYNIQFSFQFQNTNNQLQDVSVWLRKNGTTTAADVAGSGGFVSVPNSHGGTPGHVIVAWNYFVQANANDYFQLVWSTTNHTNVTMQFYAAGSPPPSCASSILTVNQVN
jgi:hypothetical protein